MNDNNTTNNLNVYNPNLNPLSQQTYNIQANPNETIQNINNSNVGNIGVDQPVIIQQNQENINNQIEEVPTTNEKKKDPNVINCCEYCCESCDHCLFATFCFFLFCSSCCSCCYPKEPDFSKQPVKVYPENQRINMTINDIANNHVIKK